MPRLPAMLTAVVVLATLSLGTLIKNKLPHPDDIRQEPYLHEAALQTPVKLRTGTVNVLRVDASARVTDGRTTAISQNGTFLVITLAFTALKQPESVSNLSVKAADGRSFGGTAPVGATTCGPSQPGIAVRCQTVFEIDKAALAGARLRIPATLMTSGNGDDVALIDLGISQAQATALAGRSTLLTFHPLAVAGEK